VNDAPKIPREAQEVVSAAAETIRQDKISLDARSERIRMYKEQLRAAEVALELALENNKLCSESLENDRATIESLEKNIEYLQRRLESETSAMKSERRKKIFWKCYAGVATAGAAFIYFFL
jgi:hypothetical protein